MPYPTNFNDGLSGYTPTVSSAPALSEWTGLEGNPTLGAAHMYTTFTSGVYYAAALTLTENYVITHNSEALWFNGKFTSNINLQLAFTNYIFGVTITYQTAPTAQNVTYLASNLLNANGFTSGWLQFNIPLAYAGHVAGDTITKIEFFGLCSLGAGSYDTQQINIWVDSIQFATSAPSFDPNQSNPLTNANAARLYYGRNGFQSNKVLEL